MVRSDQVDGAAAKSASGDARAEAAGLPRRQFHQQIRLHAACSVIVSHADVSVMHDTAKFVKISATQRRRRRKNSLVLGDHVQAATKDLFRHLAFAAPQLYLCNVPQSMNV